ncbi:MAG: PEP-CTERM sorting domain-containing protein [Planctomycetota bacterium]|jgi:hypothetical protein
MTRTWLTGILVLGCAVGALGQTEPKDPHTVFNAVTADGEGDYLWSEATNWVPYMPGDAHRTDVAADTTCTVKGDVACGNIVLGYTGVNSVLVIEGTLTSRNNASAGYANSVGYFNAGSKVLVTNGGTFTTLDNNGAFETHNDGLVRVEGGSTLSMTDRTELWGGTVEIVDSNVRFNKFDMYNDATLRLAGTSTIDGYSTGRTWNVAANATIETVGGDVTVLADTTNTPRKMIINGTVKFSGIGVSPLAGKVWYILQAGSKLDLTGWNSPPSDPGVPYMLIDSAAFSGVENFGVTYVYPGPDSYWTFDEKYKTDGHTYGHVGVEFNPLLGDANIDGKVGIADLSALADNYGRTDGAGWRQGELTGDGQVGIADLSALADNYGKEVAAVVPEPATLSLLAVAGVGALIRRKR